MAELILLQATTADISHSATTHPVAHEEPSALGISAGGWVALAMLLVFAIALFAKVPSIIAGMLDRKIAAIRNDLDEAANLRAEAEALRAEYEAKARGIDKEIAELRVSAKRQADEIVARAKQDATAMIARHQAVAEEKIASAERAVIAEIRGRGADVAAAAAAQLIADKHGADADRALVDDAIAGLARPN
jgi:F-type H+-transporting ATPase subunit b